MARFINIAAIHFQVSELGNDPQHTALAQFKEAESRLDGAGVDLVVTCEGMASVRVSIRGSIKKVFRGSLQPVNNFCAF